MWHSKLHTKNMQKKMCQHASWITDMGVGGAFELDHAKSAKKRKKDRSQNLANSEFDNWQLELK